MANLKELLGFIKLEMQKNIFKILILGIILLSTPFFAHAWDMKTYEAFGVHRDSAILWGGLDDTGTLKFEFRSKSDYVNAADPTTGHPDGQILSEDNDDNHPGKNTCRGKFKDTGTDYQNHPGTDFSGFLGAYCRLFNLEPNTTYYFRACAQNPDTNHPYRCSPIINNFTTTVDPSNNPLLKTGPTEKVRQNSARLKGLFNSSDGSDIFDIWFEYSTDEQTVQENSGIPIVARHDSNGGSQTISELIPETMYYYRVCANNERNHPTIANCGEIVSFKTLNGFKPQVISERVENVQRKKAILVVNVKPNYAETTIDFLLGKAINQNMNGLHCDLNETTNSKSILIKAGTTWNEGETQWPVENLEPKTYYCFNVKIHNKYGDDEGFVKTFFTRGPEDLPESNLAVITDGADSINDVSAILKGHGKPATPPIIPPATTPAPVLPTSVYFRYSTANKPPVFCNDIYGTNMIATRDQKITRKPPSNPPLSPTDPENLVQFSQKITGLIPDTIYYYCAVISDKNDITYGYDSNTNKMPSFRTAPCSTCDQTNVETKSVDSVNEISAELKGTYRSTEVVKTYFEYRAMAQKTREGIALEIGDWIKVDETTQSKGSIGDMDFVLPKLNPNTTYQYRAVAQAMENSFTPNKRFVGQTITFKTERLSTDTGNGGYSGYNNSQNNTNYGDFGNGNNFDGENNSFNNYGDNSSNNSGPSFTLGQTATPPVDATVHSKEGVETVFARQIVGNKALASKYGYTDGQDLQTFAGTLAHSLAITFGYISASGKEIRVAQADVAAYQLEFVNDKLTVYEYFRNIIINIQDVTSVFKNVHEYEYTFKK